MSIARMLVLSCTCQIHDLYCTIWYLFQVITVSTVCSPGYETWGPMNSQDVTSCVFNHVTMEGRNLRTIPKISAWRSWTAALICCWNQRAPQAGTDGSGPILGPYWWRPNAQTHIWSYSTPRIPRAWANHPTLRPLTLCPLVIWINFSGLAHGWRPTSHDLRGFIRFMPSTHSGSNLGSCQLYVAVPSWTSSGICSGYVLKWCVCVCGTLFYIIKHISIQLRLIMIQTGRSVLICNK